MKIVLIILALLYALSPYDLLPDLLAGWGWLDDFAILGFLLRYLYKQKQKSQATAQNTDDRRTADTRTEDPYSILGIRPDATIEEIRHAYRELATKYHPDKVDHLGEEFKTLAEKRFKEIQAAYDALMKGKR